MHKVGLITGWLYFCYKKSRYHDHLILLQSIHIPPILVAAYSREVNAFLCLHYLSSTPWLKSLPNRQRWLRQSLSHLHNNHLPATQKEAKCHIIGRCVKVSLFSFAQRHHPVSFFHLSSLTAPQIICNSFHCLPGAMHYCAAWFFAKLMIMRLG